MKAKDFAAFLLFFLSKAVPLIAVIARSRATHAFNHWSIQRQTRRRKSNEWHWTCKNVLFDIIDICANRRIKNFNPNIIIVSKVVIDDANKYKPQPTSHTILFLNVIIQIILFTNRIII